MTRPAVAGRRGGGAARWAGWLLGLAVIAALVVAGSRAGAALAPLLRTLEEPGPVATAAFIAGYAVATVALIPGSLMTLAAGAVFGVWTGTLYVFAGATLGAVLAFLIARYAARRAVERKLAGDGRLERVDRAIGRQGLRIVLLLRLSPVFPFVILNYALGVTRVRFRDYLIGSIGMIPGTLLYVYSGRVAGDLALLAAGAGPGRGFGGWLALGLGLVATAAATLYIARVARRALREETA
jgi:uncharacterized membrane protein YdjX (TVP38/TMEM64 family)